MRPLQEKTPNQPAADQNRAIFQPSHNALEWNGSVGNSQPETFI